MPHRGFFCFVLFTFAFCILKCWRKYQKWLQSLHLNQYFLCFMFINFYTCKQKLWSFLCLNCCKGQRSDHSADLLLLLIHFYWCHVPVFQRPDTKLLDYLRTKETYFNVQPSSLEPQAYIHSIFSFFRLQHLSVSDCHKTSFLSSVSVMTHPNLPCSQCSVITFGVDLEDFLLSLDSFLSGHKLCDTVAAQSFGFIASVGKFSLK